MPVSATSAIRQIEVSIPVPITVIPGTELREIDGVCILGDDVARILSPLAWDPGFIGFKTKLTGDIADLLTSPAKVHLLFYNVTADDVAEIGIYGQVQGRLIHWNRQVYVMGKDSSLPEAIFEIPFGAEVWVCGRVTEANCGSLMSAFCTPDPNVLLEA